MGDWTSQNWTKRDGRNNQEEEEEQQQQQQQEKKATYKTAAELAVKNCSRKCSDPSAIDSESLEPLSKLKFKW